MAKLVTNLARYTARSFARSRTECLFGESVTRMCPPILRTITTTQRLRADRWYTNKHEWVTVDGNIATVGISDYAQEALGDVVYAQLPDAGTTILKEEECGALESVKAASELYSPVSGKVTVKNEAVENKPGLINSSCYNEGWLFKLELSDPDEVKNLMDEPSYNKFLDSGST